MADQLKRYIYHDKQEQGSALCAQHALNSLLQQPIFTTVDLATIAQSLDSMEHETSYDTQNRSRNTNMDDTGFFSIQVLENALQVWGLTLIRWRSQEMQPYQDKPYTRLAFILNLEEHWFTLRRFGPANPDVTKDDGIGHWFNLNSFLPDPEWVSRTYLGMVLQQAETEGYSVFVVSQIDPNAPLALPRTKADEVAATIPEITSGSNRISTSRTLPSSGGTSKNTAEEWASIGLEDEDMALQAALYASVMGQPESEPASTATPASITTSAPTPASASVSTPTAASVVPEVSRPTAGSRRDSEEWDIRGASSVFGGSSSRARAPPASTALARFEEEQMGGLNDPIVGDEESDRMIARVLSRERGAEDVTSPSVPLSRTRPQRQRREDEEEEEMMRRAIEASKQEAEEAETEDVDMIHFDDDDHHGFLDDEDEERELQRLLEQRRQNHQTLLPELPSIPPLDPSPLFDPLRMPILGANASHLSRNYDDEDAELQAALKASLEGASPDLTIPTPPRPATRAPTAAEEPAAASTSTSTSAKKHVESDEEDDDEEEESDEEMESPKQLTAEEMRKARLARFGS